MLNFCIYFNKNAKKRAEIFFIIMKSCHLGEVRRNMLVSWVSHFYLGNKNFCSFIFESNDFFQFKNRNLFHISRCFIIPAFIISFSPYFILLFFLSLLCFLFISIPIALEFQQIFNFLLISQKIFVKAFSLLMNISVQL